jgi:RHS repeat-associated protein
LGAGGRAFKSPRPDQIKHFVDRETFRFLDARDSHTRYRLGRNVPSVPFGSMHYSVGAAQGQGGGGTPQVTAPSYSPAPGNYTSSSVAVTITTPTPSAIIRYTVDGSTPSLTNGVTYSGPVSVAANETLTAYAYESGMTDSPVTAGGYTVQTGGSYPAFLTSYAYDLLNHLTLVSMTRGSTTQTRIFNYTKPGNIVGAELLSATNPENGTVIYTYNANHTLATKTDANGTVFNYSYDPMNRPVTLTVNGVSLRTYTYDANSIDPSYSQHTFGRLATITYPLISYDVAGQSPQGTTTFTDMFSYTGPGQIAGKRLRVTKVNPYTQSGQHFQTANGNLDMSYTYNAEGKLTNVTYPLDSNNNTPQYNYSYDAMMRANAMTDQSSSSIVSGVQYGAANQMLSMSYDSGTETRTYNSMLQLTNITFASTLLNQNITYTFPSGTNNGKISSQTDSISGETVTYQYDSLNRLIQAQGSGWGQTYTYDGFGNLTNRAGSGAAPSMALTVDATTNRLGAPYSYDLNGNLISTGNLYDVENRLRQATMPGGTIHYAYDGSNKRIWQGTFTNSGDPQLLNFGDLVSMFGIDGQLAGTYTALPAWTNSTTQTTISFQVNAQRVYFGKKLLAWMDGSGTRHSAVADRVGSVGKYYPYGEERNSPPLSNDQVKFATYTRDSVTGNDYADQRYYVSTFGRFTTADRYPTAAQYVNNPASPQTWNRYSYVVGDPINLFDPFGTAGRSTCGHPSGLPISEPPISPGTEGAADPGGYYCIPDEPQGGGGNSFQDTMRTSAQSALDSLGAGCKKALESHWDTTHDATSIWAKAGSDLFMDGRDPAVSNAPVYSIGYDPLDTRTIGDLLISAAAVVGQNPNGTPNNKIVIGKKFYSVPDANWKDLGLEGTPSLTAWQNQVLVHEVLHTYAGQGDVELAKTLGLGNFDSAQAASAALNLYILSDCTRKP